MMTIENAKSQTNRRCDVADRQVKGLGCTAALAWFGFFQFESWLM